MRFFIIFAMLNIYTEFSSKNLNSPKSNVTSRSRVSIKPFDVGDIFYMKTINFKGRLIDVYDDGRVFVHGFSIEKRNGKKVMYKGKFIKSQDNGIGYLSYHFWNNKKHDREYVHRIVAMAFLDNPNNLPEINHIDGNKSNNHVSNLEWCDRKYNVNDYVKKGRGVYRWKKVNQYDLNGNFINEYKSIKEASIALNCTPENIGMALNGKTKTAAGYKWKFTQICNETTNH